MDPNTGGGDGERAGSKRAQGQAAGRDRDQEPHMCEHSPVLGCHTCDFDGCSGFGPGVARPGQQRLITWFKGFDQEAVAIRNEAEVIAG